MTMGGIRERWAALIVCGMATSLVRAGEPRCIEPQADSGRSLAVVVDGGPLVHTTQIVAGNAASAPVEQVRAVLEELNRVLESADSRLAQSVKLNVYVRDASVTPIVERELARRFSGSHKPAVSFVETPLPGSSAAVGIDAIAVSRRADVRDVERIKPPVRGQPSPAAILPAGPRIDISGQAERGDSSLTDATKKTMASLFATLKWLELSPQDVVEVKAFVWPMAASGIVIEEIVQSFGDETPPPISLVEWTSSLPIEIELVAAARPRDHAPACEYLTPPGMTSSPVFARVARSQSPKTIYFSGLYGSTSEPSGEAEVRELFAITERVAMTAGSDLQHLVKATYYVADKEANNWHNQLRLKFYHPERPPAASKAMVAGTGRDRRTITWDLIAVPRP